VSHGISAGLGVARAESADSRAKTRRVPRNIDARADAPQEIEDEIRTNRPGLNRDAKEVYLIEQYRQARLSHRQLQDVLGLSFHQTEELLKCRGLGQEIDAAEFEASRDRLRKARP
jgi:hypothetical protein